jgi:hypothetical protein
MLSKRGYMEGRKVKKREIVRVAFAKNQGRHSHFGEVLLR